MEQRLEMIAGAYDAACRYFQKTKGFIPAMLECRYEIAKKNLVRYRALAMMTVNTVDNQNWRLAR